MRTPSRLSFLQWVSVAVAAIVGGIFLGMVGLVIGADYGGSYCNACEFNGQRGYEATGQIGFLGGVAIGLCLSGLGVSAVFRTRNAKRDRAAV